MSILGVKRDVTDRKRMAEELQEREERFRTLADTTSTAILIFQGEKFTYVNKAAEAISGFSRDELLTMRFWDVVYPEFQDLVRDRGMARQRGESIPDRYEVKILCKDGTDRWIDYTAGIIQWEGKPAVMGTAFDITERKRGEKALQEQLRFERLISGISARFLSIPPHEINREVEGALKSIVDFFRVSHSVLIKGFPEERRAEITHSAHADDFPPTPLGGNLYSLVPYTSNRMAQGEALGLATLDDLPAEAAADKEFYRNLGVRSFLIIPIYVKGSPAYAISISSRREEVVWSADYIPRLQLLGEMLVTTLERKRSEEALRQSEAQYRLLAENSTDVIWTTDLEFNLTYISPSVVRASSYTREEIMAIKASDHLTPASLSIAAGVLAEELAVEAREEKDLRRSRTLELEFIRKDGSTSWDEVSLTFIRDSEGKAIGILGVSRPINERKRAEEELRKYQEQLEDMVKERTGQLEVSNAQLRGEVSERKRMEEALRQSEERFRAVFESSTDCILVWDRQCNYLYANQAAIDHVGTTRDKVIGKNIRNGLGHVPDFMHLWMGRVEQAFATGEAFRVEDSVPVGGRLVHSESQISPIRDASGQVFAVSVVYRDITQRRRSEEKLKESEERFRLAFENANIGMCLVDLQGRLVKVNHQMCEIFGYCQNELENMTVNDIAYPEDMNLSPTFVQQAVSGGADYANFEKRYRHRQGHIVWGQVSSSLVRDAKSVPQYFISHVRDITEHKQAEVDRRNLEARIQRMEKMEALGTLAGGVAHDLNNILSGVVGYPDLILMQLPEDSPLREAILAIQRSGQRAAAAVQDLLTLARRGVVSMETLNLNEVISDYLKTPEQEKVQGFHPGVHFEVDLEEGLLPVKGSRTHLSKTVMNLLSNAAEAISGKGTVTLSTRNKYLDRPIKGYDVVKDGDYIVLTVSDSGKGISAEDRSRIFEPFYTKKVMGRSGTGLGLAVVWGTVKDHNGYIDVQSEEDRGTTFALYFPVTREPFTCAQPLPLLKDYMGEGETILVVDDVREQCKLAEDMLNKLNYKVTSVSSGEEAVEFLKTRQVDLLVLDMIMDPGIDGFETYRRILETHPGQKAIIVSGFSETERVRRAQKLGAGAYVRKPYVLEKIGLAVRQELHSGIR